MASGIEHRLTNPNSPWTNGQVDRVNGTIMEATVRRFHYNGHDQLRTYLADVMAACNFARKFNTLGGLTACAYICKIRASEPNGLALNLVHQMPGLNAFSENNHPPCLSLCSRYRQPQARKE